MSKIALVGIDDTLVRNLDSAINEDLILRLRRGGYDQVWLVTDRTALHIPTTVLNADRGTLPQNWQQQLTTNLVSRLQSEGIKVTGVSTPADNFPTPLEPGSGWQQLQGLQAYEKELITSAASDIPSILTTTKKYEATALAIFQPVEEAVEQGESPQASQVQHLLEHLLAKLPAGIMEIDYFDANDQNLDAVERAVQAVRSQEHPIALSTIRVNFRITAPTAQDAATADSKSPESRYADEYFALLRPTISVFYDHAQPALQALKAKIDGDVAKISNNNILDRRDLALMQRRVAKIILQTAVAEPANTHGKLLDHIRAAVTAVAETREHAGMSELKSLFQHVFSREIIWNDVRGISEQHRQFFDNFKKAYLQDLMMRSNEHHWHGQGVSKTEKIAAIHQLFTAMIDESKKPQDKRRPAFEQVDAQAKQILMNGECGKFLRSHPGVVFADTAQVKISIAKLKEQYCMTEPETRLKIEQTALYGGITDILTNYVQDLTARKDEYHGIKSIFGRFGYSNTEKLSAINQLCHVLTTPSKTASTSPWSRLDKRTQEVIQSTSWYKNLTTDQRFAFIEPAKIAAAAQPPASTPSPR